jgi:hypothetical protein
VFHPGILRAVKISGIQAEIIYISLSIYFYNKEDYIILSALTLFIFDVLNSLWSGPRIFFTALKNSGVGQVGDIEFLMLSTFRMKIL